MDYIYIEKAVKEYPLTIAIIEKFKAAKIIECEYYGEIFNLKAQNFRLQKQNPVLILAKKQNNLVLPTPEGFGIGGQQNYYFSHMLNCVYDCRYCFLQGMYQSANYVVFVNFDDFKQAIKERITKTSEKSYFFSGYDCDSLAYEPITGFVKSFLPFFSNHPQAILELRTKSTNVKSLLSQQPIENCVVAFSFTPSEISTEIEHKVPSVVKRITVMSQLAKQGWSIGLRFDPLIYKENFEFYYKKLIAMIFMDLNPKKIHSVSIGPIRFPSKMYQKLMNMYPRDKLLAQPFQKREQHMSYSVEIENKMKQVVLSELGKYLNNSLIFECNAL